MKKFKPSSFSWIQLLMTFFYIARRVQSDMLNQTDIVVCSIVAIGCIGYLVLYTVKYLNRTK